MMRQHFLILISLALTAFWTSGTAAAQQLEQHLSRQQMDASQAHAVRLALDLTGTLNVKGGDSPDVVVDAVAARPDGPSCPVVMALEGDTLTITMKAAAGETCSTATDLHVVVPRAFDVVIAAERAEQVRVADLAGSVRGTANPAASVYGGTHTASELKIEGPTFRLRDLRGALTLRVPATERGTGNVP